GCCQKAPCGTTPGRASAAPPGLGTAARRALTWTAHARVTQAPGPLRAASGFLLLSKGVRLLLDPRDMELSRDDSWTTLEHKTPESNKSVHAQSRLARHSNTVTSARAMAARNASAVR